MSLNFLIDAVRDLPPGFFLNLKPEGVQIRRIYEIEDGIHEWDMLATWEEIEAGYSNPITATIEVMEKTVTAAAISKGGVK